MAKKHPHLANAFLWSAAMAATLGVGEGLILHRTAEQIADATVTAGTAAFVVAYAKEKEQARRSGKLTP